MKKLISVLTCSVVVISLFFISFPVYAASVQVALPSFNVTLNGTQIENATRQYPLIVYNDITYFPMTYHDCRFLSLESNYTAQSGLDIQKTGISGNYNADTMSGRNPQRATAQTAVFSIHVNGKVVDNSREQYPLLLYKDITYFPLTWRFAVDEFGWEYSFDNVRGLTINSTQSGNNKQSGSANSGQTEIDTRPSSDEQTLTTVGWSATNDENGVALSTSFVLNFSGWPLSFSTSDLSNLMLTKDGNAIAFSFSGKVEERPLRGSVVPQVGFHVELSKPLTEPGIYVMTGTYKGKTFATDEWNPTW